MIAGSLVGRALWWLRWGAMFTFITGWLIIIHKMFGHEGFGGYGGIREVFASPYAWEIFFGGVLGSPLWVKVLVVILPAQKGVIASPPPDSQGGPGLSHAAPPGPPPRVSP